MDSQKVEAALAAASKVVEVNKDKKDDEDKMSTSMTDKEIKEESPSNTSNGQGQEHKDPGAGSGGDNGNSSEKEQEKVEFKVVFNKKKYDINFPLDADVGALKAHLQPIINIPPAMMKVMIKGLAKDEMTLRKLGLTKGTKVMVVGSSLNDVLAVNAQPTPKDLEESKSKSSTSSSEQSSSRQKMHKKVLDKGKPDDVMPGIKGAKESLPPTPLSGMLNKSGGKVRLTFKAELDQVWIGTKERTEKVGMGSIKNVVSEPIEGHEEYHILAIQLGPTEASRYWVYWVPAQYVDAIKETILGKWQFY